MVNPDPAQVFFSHASSYRSSRLQSPINNNRSGKYSPSPFFLQQYSRKRSSNILPPLSVGEQRSRRSRVRTVPSSRAGSSKQTKLELEPVLGKRSRSASEEPLTSLSSLASPRVSQAHARTSPGLAASSSPPLEIRGTESLLQFTPASEDTPLYTQSHGHAHRSHAPSRHFGPRRLAKVETIRVLRARSALLLPLPSPAIPALSPSISCQPLVLKSEDRKKKRR